ncbi:MAG TPA: hypothetical protein VE057_20215 [Archangium sp.]|nr:hypothetical protein [Archangium sp.]
MGDDVNKRKEEIRRRLRLSRYPRRDAAVFTDENDHNPLILEDCPRCGGRRTVCTSPSPDTYVLDECPACGGLGTTTEVVPYFADTGPEAEAVVDEHGWLTCPRCERRFSTRYRQNWTGRRHLTCGQAIRLVHR